MDKPEQKAEAKRMHFNAMNIGLLLCGICACALLFCLIHLRPRELEVSPLLSEFLQLYLDKDASRYVTGEGNLYYRYFSSSCLENATSWDGMDNPITMNFDSVFEGLTQDIASWAFEGITDEFVIVRLFDEENELLSPPVGVWYRIEDEKICDYRLARLQPFSRYDSEYSELWEKVYG